MSNKKVIIGQRKKIALVAHDHKKEDLLEWVRFNKGTLLQHELSPLERQAKSWNKHWVLKSQRLRAAL